jgi:serine phosphatase RsbU (regulator of sigma subunit)
MLAHGTKYFVIGTALSVVNYVWAGLVMGFQFFQPVSFGLTLASGVLTLFYPVYLASVVHIRTKMLKNSKIKLREQKEMMQELNEELNQLNEEISTTLETVSAQKTEIQKQHFDITQSISYAKQIQEAFMPSLEFIAHTIPHSFILYRPRDVVSGDFYYINQHADKIFIAAVDCTGHGIPGAFMSFLGNDLLTEIIVNRNTLEPDLILNKMSKGIRRVLRQAETNNRDGMDIAIAVIDHQAKTLAYSGARNPLIYIQNQHLHTVKADSKSIGGEQREEHKIFTKHLIDISLPTTFYLFTDGFQDQFGGKTHKKFMIASLRKKLLEIHQKPLPEQRNILNDTLDHWIAEGKERQTDDILLIGVKV